MPPLPIPDLLNSIASGAHYSGGYQERAADQPLHPKPWRARSRERSSDHPEVELRFKDVMDDLEQLYCCKPTPDIIQRRFRADATVDHPWFTCAGIRDIAAVIFAMVRFVASSERVSARMLSAGLSPNRLTYIQTHRYVLRFFGSKREVTSVVFVYLDDDMKIAQLIDRWDGEEHSTRWDFFSFRTLVAKALSWTTRVPEELRRRRV
ncbi:hypothetical protein C8Q76DRAFT_796215 [Earliella scabrosa]|nr:hypothetical protein C8Q76DRAFT_796215 [Earliella scabrosa]